MGHHTHYLRLDPEHDYVRRVWEREPTFERTWVPWDWCETVKTQPQNNSIVLFSPGNNTIHGVKASYNHLGGQRTQLYGNIWYKESPRLRDVEWEQLARGEDELALLAKSRNVEPTGAQLKTALKRAAKALLGRGSDPNEFRRKYR
jgi:hypothetical protein